jgi:hypothetical protein
MIGVGDGNLTRNCSFGPGFHLLFHFNEIAWGDRNYSYGFPKKDCMEEQTNESIPGRDTGQESLLNLGTWLGRHQAFGLIANQCSAGDAECLKIMRENEEYKKLGLSWEEFCIVHAGVSRVYADRLIHYLEEFGANYFRLAELMKISGDTYRLVADSVSEEGIEFNGQNIPINRQNRRKILAAVRAKRSNAEPKAARQPKVASARKRLDAFLIEARTIAATSAQRGELMVLLDQALEQLTHLVEEVRRSTVIVN